MIELKKLSVEDGRDIYDMLQAMPKNENGLINNVNGLTWEKYKILTNKCPDQLEFCLFFG